jgi:TetR/AcrR family transcriptional repressor of mexJK operon
MTPTPEPPGAETLSPERRARIIAGASQIFIAEGYEGASMSQIAASAGVSKGTLYNYFPSKHALFAAFVGNRCDQFVHEVLGDLQDDGPVELELKRIGRVMLKLMMAPASQAVFRVVVMEAAKFPDLARTFMKAGPEELVGRLTQWLITQNRAGRRLHTPDPLFAAEQFFSLIQARLVLRSRVDPAYHATGAEIDQVLDGAVRVFLAAYAKPAECRPPGLRKPYNLRYMAGIVITTQEQISSWIQIPPNHTF